MKIACRYNSHRFERRIPSYRARVAKLVDAADSKSAASDGVPVQVRPLVPTLKPTL